MCFLKSEKKSVNSVRIKIYICSDIKFVFDKFWMCNESSGFLKCFVRFKFVKVDFLKGI